jgi:hypothetical protein
MSQGTKLPRIKTVKPVNVPFVLSVEWDDGFKSRVDLTGLIHSSKHFGIFANNPAEFRKAHIIDWGSGIAWPNELDFSSSSLRKIAEEQKPMSGSEFAECIANLRLNVDEAAMLMGCTARTIRDARQRDEIPMVWAAMLRRCAQDRTFFAAMYRPVEKRPPGRPKTLAAVK